MYYDHFKLTGEPFSLTPDPAFLYLGAKHREAMAAVQYGLVNGRGFISLIGEVGTGKTTILYSVLSRLGPEMAVAYIPYAAQEFEDLLTAALKDFGARVRPGASRLELLESLQRMLARRDAAGQRTALVIDEAQTLSDATFEALRLLSNFETYTHKLLQMVLVGQPELGDRLRQQNLRQLRQRVSVRAVIQPLDPNEMRSYILHRLGQVGGDERLFEPAALRIIVRQAKGIPRRANVLCHNALLFAYGRNLPAVTARIASEAAAEMNDGDSGRGLGTLRALLAGRTWRPAAGAAAAAVALAVSGMLLGSARSTGVEEAPATRAPREVRVAYAPPEPAAPVVEPPAAPAAVESPADQPRPSAPPPSSDGQDELRTISIEAGESVISAAGRVYGRSLSEGEQRALLIQLPRLNPGLRDVNVVRVGSVVRLPADVSPSRDPDRRTPE